MSGAEAVGIIAGALAKHQPVGSRLVSTGPAVNIASEIDGYRFRISCRCGWFTLVAVDQTKRPEGEKDFGAIHAAHQASVIAALPGIAIVALPADPGDGNYWRWTDWNEETEEAFHETLLVELRRIHAVSVAAARAGGES